MHGCYCADKTKGRRTLEILEKILGGIDGGRVLDVATQKGYFVQVLVQHLKSYTEIVGIDINEEHIETARSNIDEERVQFLVMDANRLDFEDGYFDTVTISASLHHLTNIPQVLGEMARVLKSGGNLLIVEMHRDAPTEAGLTFVYLHEWVAEVDTALGHVHNPLLARQDFVNYVENLGLSSIAVYDFDDQDSNPAEKERIKILEELIDRTMPRIEGISNKAKLTKRAEELRRRLHTVGAQDEPRILIVGKK